MIELLKFILFIANLFLFGFTALSKILNLKNISCLLVLSLPIGISFFIFTCHLLSYLVGPTNSCLITSILMFATTLSIYFLKKREKIHFDITPKQIFILTSITTIIDTLSFSALYRFGTFDKDFHCPLVLTIFHNNIYPPRDLFRPDYSLLYHPGGDLLAGSIYSLCGLDISRSFESIFSLLAGVTFLGFFLIALYVTKNFNISLLAGFCTYFGGGLLWLDAISRFIIKGVPENWSLPQTLLSLGIHGSITNPPSVCAFISTFGTGYPLIICSIIMFWELLERPLLKDKIKLGIFTLISLFSLYLSAEWLYMSFFVGAACFLFFRAIFKEFELAISGFTVLLSSFILTKTIGDFSFLQDPILQLGRTNLFNLAVKQNLFWITSWGGRFDNDLMAYKPVYFFSWESLSEFGLSLFLLPIAIWYLFKTKNKLGFLLFSFVITTMPIPILIDFKTSAPDINRLFAFGNNMIILLIVIGISNIFRNYFQKIFLSILFVVCTCFSPILGLIASSIFTPFISYNKTYSQAVFNSLNSVKSFTELQRFFSEVNISLFELKNGKENAFKNEIAFLRANSKPGDVAISSIQDLPLLAGIYTIIPSKFRVYHDQLYSTFDTIFPTVFSTLDLNLLNELNIKWILISKDVREKLPESVKENLSDSNIFKPAYINSNGSIEIFYINNSEQRIRTTAWFLANSAGQPIELSLLKINKITLFKSLKESLIYLNNLYKTYPELKKDLITSQAIEIKRLESQLKASNLNIPLEKSNF